MLQNQFEVVSSDKSLQRILHWELGDDNPVLRKVADDREKISDKLFDIIMPEFEESNVDLRARLALIIGGIYYLSIHATSNGSNFCGLILKKERIALLKQFRILSLKPIRKQASRNNFSLLSLLFSSDINF